MLSNLRDPLKRNVRRLRFRWEEKLIGRNFVLLDLSDREREIVLQSLNAILRGGFLDGEFHTRLGIEREELEEVVSAYPNLDDKNHGSKVSLAIKNCLNEVSRNQFFFGRVGAMVCS